MHALQGNDFVGTVAAVEKWPHNQHNNKHHRAEQVTPSKYLSQGIVYALSSALACHQPWLVISFVISLVISFVISFVIGFVIVLVIILVSYFVIIPALLALSFAVILSGNTASTTNTNASDSQLCGASRTHKGI